MRESVLRSCLELLVEGKVELPVSEVAERSGVNRGTVYRWWPTAGELLTDAVLFHYDQRIVPPDTGSWDGDVRAVMVAVADLMDEPVERAIMGAMATGRYPALNELMLQAWHNSLPQWIEMVERGVDRGEVRPGTDAEAVLGLMMGPLTLPALFGGGSTSEQMLESLTELILQATVVG